jgi:hypothetical protein
MKKIIFIITVLLISYTGTAQNTGVEKSIYSIEAGVLGFWLNNEVLLSNEIGLKNEMGMNAGLRGCSDCDTQYALTPVLTLEPRWYYNIVKRSAKGKIIKNNSANYATLGFTYYPDWFVISNAPNARVENQITIIPKWGIKRTISNSNFNYELGIGIGKRYYFDSDEWDTAADLLIRIGYTF